MPSCLLPTLLGAAAGALTYMPFDTVSTWRMLRQTSAGEARRSVTRTLGWRALWQGAALLVPLSVADAYVYHRLRQAGASAAVTALADAALGLVSGFGGVVTVGLLTAQRNQSIFAYAWERRRALPGVVRRTAPLILGMTAVTTPLNYGFAVGVEPWLPSQPLSVQLAWATGIVVAGALLVAPLQLALAHRAADETYGHASAGTFLRRYGIGAAWTGIREQIVGCAIAACVSGVVQVCAEVALCGEGA